MLTALAWRGTNLQDELRLSTPASGTSKVFTQATVSHIWQAPKPDANFRQLAAN
jgi:hypothetical protein